MPETFKTQVRQVGTSLGVLIPREVVRKERLKEGEEVEIGLLKKRKLADIEKAFGIAPTSRPFEREKRGRVF